VIDHPPYFEQIREKAEKRWDQLEQDRELAGPWHQLFNQVQNPRHIVSELLQNADDVGATKASVDILGGEFIFAHNGADFIEEHFASLCSFGYSNKRALHTIGFRGIGFKSTFSLGDEVRLITPTLSVAFRRHRFTEPVWVNGTTHPSHLTEVRVTIEDEHRRHELEKNLKEWETNPVSLLFFQSIRHLRIGQQEIQWISKGPGPIADSERVGISTNPEEEYLLIRSAPKIFPDEALEEVRQERMVAIDEETCYPPCRVEIVFGVEGRLFVILPTEVKTALPFAANAPFIQDPARMKIKDPEMSPTNRWLLKRIGELTAMAMLEWLDRKDLKIDKRSKAYNLLPDVDREDNSLEGCCATRVEEAFQASIGDERFLLSEKGALKKKDTCISVPNVILDVWTPAQVKTLFCKDNRTILCRHISTDNKKKLSHWGWIDELDRSDILNVVRSKHLPKPKTWRQLLTLWMHIFSVVDGYYQYRNYADVRIFPVQGSDVLYRSGEVVRLGEKKLLQSQEDWEFLSEHLLVVNPNWLRFLTKQRREAEQMKDDELGQQAETAHKVLEMLKLDESSDVNSVIEQVALNVFAHKECSTEDCIQLAQIAAKLGASARRNFRFISQDSCIRGIDQYIVADIEGDLDRFVEEEWYEEHVIHNDYWRNFTSCGEFEWKHWVTSGRSGLLTFVPIIQIQKRIGDRGEIRRLLHERGLKKELVFPYVTHDFILSDWDFEEKQWQYWESLAKQDSNLWGRLFSRILTQPKGHWSKAISAKVSQEATTGTKKAITNDQILPAWIIKFRGLPCLQDTRGHYRQPAELLRRTPETEALLDVESFVRAEYDTEHSRPLLVNLGVRDTPTGPDRLLDRLRALASVENPPVYEVEKWYHRLDQILPRCSTQEYLQIKNVFATEKIILTEDSGWVRTPEVFLSADEEDVPDAPIIHVSVRSLALWHKIGVAERPSFELALNWLRGIPSGWKLSQDELRRVRSLLPRYAERIWNECAHWLNLEGEWAKAEGLTYKLTMQSLIPWGNLFPSIKQKTADLQRLPSEICQQYPFSELLSLATSIEDHFLDDLQDLPKPQPKPWLKALGSGLARVELENEDETLRVWEYAERLMKTQWQTASGLRIVPYIDGTPAGTPRSINALWKEDMLYVEDRPIPQLFKPIAQELARPFDRQDITEAIKACIKRSPEFVAEYLEENFKLIPPEKVEPETKDEPGDDDAIKGSPEHPVGDSQTSTGGPLEPDDVPDDFENDAIDDDQDREEEDDDSSSAQSQHISPKTPKRSLIELFAIANGYNKESSERFYHSNGNWLSKVSGNTFPWELYSSSGKLLRCYWAKDHCIQRDPLQLDAEVWDACNKDPGKYILLLSDQDDNPIELSGYHLQELLDDGHLVIYPAKYRLVYNEDSRRP